MECRLDLKDNEWKIVLQLLERERGDLHTEIHHTDKPSYRHELQERMRAVEDMLARLNSQPAAQSS